MANNWPTVHAERAALAQDLSSIPEEKWSSPSLCAEWTVRDTLAHMTGTAKISGLTFFPKLASCGFRFTAMQTKAIETEKGASPSETLSRFTSVVDSEKHPPGPSDTWLGEVIIHSEDIRRPLGIATTTRRMQRSGWPTSTRAPIWSSEPRSGSAACNCAPPTLTGPTARAQRSRVRSSRWS